MTTDTLIDRSSAGEVHEPEPVPPDTMRRLRAANGVLALLHGASAAAIVILGNDFTLPVTSTFWDGPPASSFDPARLEVLADVRIAWGSAAFLAITACFHLALATVAAGSYERELRRGRNRFRWVEYSITASLMIVLIAMITGITDVVALIALAGANAAMILFGWIMEVVNRPGPRTWWGPFVMGSVIGIVPWVGIAIYLFGPGDEVPSFVYVIFLTIFVFFNSFAVNQWLQYRRVGPWRRYLFGEGAYAVLSLTSKSALAWQIFANTLA